jgi:hypothetical protein
MTRIVIHSHLPKRKTRDASDKKIYAHYRLLRMFAVLTLNREYSGTIELVEGQLADKGKWAVYGPGGWTQFSSLAAATKHYENLAKFYS